MSYQTFADFKNTLKSLELEQILYLYLIEGTPYIFKNNNAKYQVFRKSISSSLDVPIKNIVIVGSARLGFSLNPYHFGRNFSKKLNRSNDIRSHLQWPSPSLLKTPLQEGSFPTSWQLV